MQDHHMTAIQAIKSFKKDLKNPSSYSVTYMLGSVNDLRNLYNLYDLMILDRDCTLHGYHAKKRIPEFEDTLRLVSKKGEIVSNSSFEEVLRIDEIFGDILPVSQVVNFSNGGDGIPYLLRFNRHKLSIFQYFPKDNLLSDVTSQYKGYGYTLLDKISNIYKKPNPLIISAVKDVNIFEKRVPDNPRLLMVGDRYLTDIVCGNLAGVDTARVTPYKPFSDRLDLQFTRWVFDSPIGFMMRLIDQHRSRTSF